MFRLSGHFRRWSSIGNRRLSYIHGESISIVPLRAIFLCRVRVETYWTTNKQTNESSRYKRQLKYFHIIRYIRIVSFDRMEWNKMILPDNRNTWYVPMTVRTFIKQYTSSRYFPETLVIPKTKINSIKRIDKVLRTYWYIYAYINLYPIMGPGVKDRCDVTMILIINEKRKVSLTKSDRL